MEMLGGTIRGFNHDKNQDAYSIRSGEDGCLVGVVCDGCGSTPYSEYGARFFAHRMSAFTRNLPIAQIPSEAAIRERFLPICWGEFLRSLSTHLESLTEDSGREEALEMCSSHFLSTVHVLVRAEGWIFAFGSGDGVWWKDTGSGTEVQSIEAVFPNAPAYPAFHLFPEEVEEDRLHDCPFELYFAEPEDEVEFAGIGSDGVDEMIDRKGEEIRGGDTVGGVDQFREKVFIQNQSLVRKRLRSLAHVNQKLYDDTTVAFLTRADESDDESSD